MTAARIMNVPRMLTLLVVLALPAYADDVELDAMWSWQHDGVVDWCRAVDGEMKQLTVATRDHQLFILDAATGIARLDEPLHVGRGASPAQGTPPAGTDVFCTFSRHTIRAISTGPTCEQRWRHGPAEPVRAEFPGDPEVLQGWTVVAHSEHGLLALHSQGSVALFDYTNGKQVWTLSVGKHAFVELFVLRDRAVILQKVGKRLEAAFIEVSGRRPELRRLDLGDTWPIWSGLTTRGLLTVNAIESQLWTANAPPRRFDIDIHHIRRAAVQVTDAPNELLLYFTDGPRPIAHDLLNNERRWPRDRLHPVGLDLLTLEVCGDNLLGTDELGAIVFDRHTGRVRAHQLDPRTRSIAAAVRHSKLYVVRQTRGAGTSGLRMARVTVDDPSAESGEGDDNCATWKLDGATGVVRDVIWTDAHVIIVMPHELRAFPLP